VTRARLDSLRTGEPVRAMERERAIVSKDGGGAFAGFKTYCVLQPPPYGTWTYECWGEAYRQHGDRVCSLATEWASGHMTERRLVSAMRGDQLQPVASCSTGYASYGDDCPDPYDDAEVDPGSHWNTNPTHVAGLPNPRANDLWKYDPDIELYRIEQKWMRDCLFAPVFPPPELSRPNSKGDASGRQ
jgi:hypothetical protein